MNNFDYHITTDIRFGHNQIQCLPEELAKFGKKVLLVYGVGSIKKNGIYDTLKSLLKDFEVFELPGIEPNPRVTSVDEGARICKEKGICQTKAFFREMGLPTSLSEVGISSEHFEELAKEAVRTSSIDTDDVYYQLAEKDVVKIFRLCE